MKIFKVNRIERWVEAPQIKRLKGRKSLKLGTV